MGRAVVLCGVLWVGALSTTTSAFQNEDRGQAEEQAKVVDVQAIRENLYLLKGGGGNTVVFITSLGVVVVDTKLSGWGQPMLDAIQAITSRPVTTLINSHAHGDHAGGNELFGTAVEIVAHDNTRQSMETMEAFQGSRVNFLPKLMFDGRMSLGSGKDRIDLMYFGQGHTDGDAWVVFPALRVMHAGDMFSAKQLPLIDRKNGGSGIAYAQTLERAASALKDVDIIITGHGGTMTTADLAEYSRFNREFRDVVVDGFNRGLSVDEVVSGWTLPEEYRGYTADPQRVKDTVELMFGELAE